MRQLKNKPKFSFSSLLSRSIVFSPALIDDRDELLQAIEYDANNRDNNWTLDERPDPEDLQAYLQNALSDTAVDEFHD